MFDIESLLGSDIEKWDEIEPENFLRKPVVKESVIEEMVDVLIREMLNRQLLGYDVNEGALEGLVKAKSYFLLGECEDLQK